MDQLTLKPFLPRPRRNQFVGIVAGGNGDAASAEVARRARDKPAALFAVYPANLGPELDAESEPSAILTQVLDDVGPPGPATIAARHPVAGQVRESTRGV